MRRLLSIRRSVPAERRPNYDALWSTLEEHSRAGGFHAWRFRAAATADEYIEFLEFAPEIDPRRLPTVSAALEALRTAFPDLPPPARAEEEWIGIEP